MIEGLLGFELRPRGHHWVPVRELGVGDRSVTFHSPDSAQRTAWRNDAIMALTVSRSAPNKPSRIVRHDQSEIRAGTSFVAFDGRTLGIQKCAGHTLARLA
jgi:hypothetical protein